MVFSWFCVTEHILNHIRYYTYTQLHLHCKYCKSNEAAVGNDDRQL